jgi:signal recognition particle receptor subunit beta
MTSEPKIVRTHVSSNGVASKPLKIVVTGPFSAGKTTLIETISEIAIVGTDRTVTDESMSTKTNTTVAMDFGRMTFDGGLCLFLFGTPGQRRFEVMWEILAEGMIGFIMLVNAADERSADEAAHILDTFRKYADVPYIIGVTHLDKNDRPQHEVLAEVRRRLGAPDEIKVVGCDVREREQVKSLILGTLFEVLERLERRPAVMT